MKDARVDMWLDANGDLTAPPQGQLEARGDDAMPGNIEELVERVRYLVAIVATTEPDRARAELDALITTHGHALIAAIRTAVAPATYPGLTSEQDTTASRSAADDLEQTDASRHSREGPPQRRLRDQ